MAITRRSLADTYEQHDAIIEAAQTAKREATQAYRKQLDEQGRDKDSIKVEVEGFKVAYRRKVAVDKKGVDEVDHRDAVADEIFLEITAVRAPRATRVENIEEFHADTGEIIEPNSSTQPQGERGTALSRDVSTGGEDVDGRAHSAEGEAPSSPPQPSVVTFRKLKMNPEFFDPPHPACRQPKLCGGNSNIALCETCKVAAGLLTVEPGGTPIERKGEIA